MISRNPAQIQNLLNKPYFFTKKKHQSGYANGHLRADHHHNKTSSERPVAPNFLFQSPNSEPKVSLSCKTESCSNGLPQNDLHLKGSSQNIHAEHDTIPEIHQEAWIWNTNATNKNKTTTTKKTATMEITKKKKMNSIKRVIMKTKTHFTTKRSTITGNMTTKSDDKRTNRSKSSSMEP